jgi:hypothetical protein
MDVTGTDVRCGEDPVVTCSLLPVFINREKFRGELREDCSDDIAT